MQELDDIKTIDMDDFGFLDNNESYLDDLLDEELGAKKDNNEFSMTFVFDINDKEDVDEFIDKFGKDHLTNEIIKMIRGVVNA